MEVTANHTESGSPAAGFGTRASRTSGSAARAALDGILHVAIAADDRATVDAFHRAALAAGGKDNGAPGLRPHYHPSYYGAFVLDPDGHNVEAVCHAAGLARRTGGCTSEPGHRAGAVESVP